MHLGARTRQPLTKAPTAASPWHAWLRVLALTVIAVGVGLTFATANAHASPLGDHLKAKHEARTTGSRDAGKALVRTTERVTKPLTSGLEETTKSLTGNAGRHAKRSDGRSSAGNDQPSATHRRSTESTEETSKQTDEVGSDAPGKIKNDTGKIKNDDASRPKAGNGTDDNETPARTKAKPSTSDKINKPTDKINNSVETAVTRPLAETVNGVAHADRSTTSESTETAKPEHVADHNASHFSTATGPSTGTEPTAGDDQADRTQAGAHSTSPKHDDAASSEAAVPTTTVGKIADDDVLAPVADVVSATGSSHPTTELVTTTADLVTTAAKPSRLVPQVVHTVAEVTPREIRPVVDQVGATTTQVTDPVTGIADTAVDATEPVVGVRDVVDSVAAPLKKPPTSTIDDALPNLTEPVAETIRATGGVVRAVAPVPVPTKTVDDLGSGLDDLSGGISEGVSSVADGVAGSLHQVSAALTPATDVVGLVGDEVSSVVDRTGGAVRTPLPTPLVPLPGPPGSPTSSQPPTLPIVVLPGTGPSRVLHAPAAVLPSAPTAIVGTVDGFLRLAPHTAAIEVDGIHRLGGTVEPAQLDLSGPRLVTVSLTALQPAGHSADATTDRPGDVHTATDSDHAPITLQHGSDASPGATGSTGSGSAAGAAGAGGAQPASTAYGMTVLDLEGVDHSRWDDESGTIRTAYDPGFSPD